VNGALTEAMIRNPGFATFAIWLDKIYPTFQHIKARSQGTKVLIQPSPSDHAIRYPIPVTFYQDVQQHEFWDVGVRTFGFHLLHYRSVREGRRINYRHNFNWITWEHVHSLVGGPVRLSGGDQPFPAISAGFEIKLRHFETALRSTPFQREAIGFGRDMVRSAQEEHAFWANYTKQEERVKQIFVQAARPRAIDDEPLELLTIMTTLISEASYFHSTMVRSIIDSEKASGITNDDRRLRILELDRGCRRCIRDVLDNCTPSTDRAQMVKLEDLVGNLESCRMSLWSPINSLAEAQDHREYTEILSAEQNDLRRRENCNRILGDSGSSVFARCCANIMICSIDFDKIDAWKERRDILAQQITTLEELQKLKIADWEAPIEAWGTLAMQAQVKIAQYIGAAQHAQVATVQPGQAAEQEVDDPAQGDNATVQPHKLSEQDEDELSARLQGVSHEEKDAEMQDVVAGQEDEETENAP
jgi:hypothetical protein